MRAPACVSAGDRNLVERLRAGEEAAFLGLVSRYHGSLVRLARVFVGSHEAAEDVAQETWLAVLNGLDAFEGRGTLKAWIFSILVNRAKTRGQRDKRWVPLSDGADDPDGEWAVDRRRFSAGGSWLEPPEPWAETSPEGLLLRREAVHAIEHALADLPPAQQAVVTMRDIEGLSAKEVCNTLQVSDVHQRVLLHRGRSKLRAAMEKALASTLRPTTPRWSMC
ncbi:MAG: sigma-70 family RNA polymerase sigma factor [Acidobacteria bacterium]|nr:sigma-70 family RNA polymerase sigma factor [Acidobacteriota bacterium]